MKTLLVLTIAVLTACCGGSTTTAWASVAVQGEDAARITVDYVLSDMDLTAVLLDGQAATQVTLEGALPRQDKGFPELPTLAVSLNIPGFGTPQLKIVSRRERELAIAPILPSLGHVTRDLDPATLTREFGAIYSSAATYPAEVAQLESPFILADRRGVHLRLNPLRWDAARGVLLVTEALTVEITTSGSGGVNELPAATPRASRAIGSLQQQVFANLPEITSGVAHDKYAAPIARGRLLIISADEFAPALAEYRAWKLRRGIASDLVLMSDTDGTAAGLRQLVADNYHAAPGLSWLVLVGDKAQVPTNVGTYDGSDADSPYAMIVGDDLYPEIMVSRISASDIKQVEVQINKFITYERHPDTGADAGWYSRAVGVASDEGVPADYERADLLRSDLLAEDYASVDRIYQGLGASTASITAAVNDGRSLINYLGHGSGLSWDSVVYRNSDIAGLQNGSRLPWIIDVSCFNGDFNRDTCFAEAWLQAGTVDNPAGAVGMIAASSLAPWTPPTVMQAEVVDLLAAGTETNLGALYYSGLMQVLDDYAGIPVATQVMEQNIVFGDATLQVRTRAPQEYKISQPTVADASLGALTIAVMSGGPGTVAVTRDGQLVGVTDFTGLGPVQVPYLMDVSKVPELEITVTGANMVPWEGQTAVVSGATPVFDPLLPSRPTLHGNYPNPFNPSTRIVFELPSTQTVQLTVFDVQGRQVRRLVDGSLEAGVQEITWHGRDERGRAAASGVYLYHLVTSSGSQTGRMVLSK